MHFDKLWIFLGRWGGSFVDYRYLLRLFLKKFERIKIKKRWHGDSKFAPGWTFNEDKQWFWLEKQGPNSQKIILQCSTLKKLCIILECSDWLYCMSVPSGCVLRGPCVPCFLHTNPESPFHLPFWNSKTIFFFHTFTTEHYNA